MKKKNKSGDKDIEFFQNMCFWYWLIATFIGGIIGGIVAVGLIKLLQVWRLW